ncbi:MAG: hypothetical protein ACTSSG_01095 [Candidatus Heimdallarchaeaceae archaeon]
MKLIFRLFIITMLVASIFTAPIIAQDSEVLYYYSDKMVKNGTFIWNVTKSHDYYEKIPEGAEFSVKLKDSLYPGPVTEADLNKVYATIKVDGNKYTGNGFPLFWHISREENGTTTTIREDFESEPTYFNVSDVEGSIFNVNFTIVQDNYTLFVEMDINGTDGLTVRYFENLTDYSSVYSWIELIFLSFTIEAPIRFGWSLLGLLFIPIILAVRRRKRRK